MANVGIERTKLDNLAVVISDRTGKPLPMKVDDMIDALGALRTTTKDKWERPSDWPDLSKLDVSAGDVLYMTSYADEARGFCDFEVLCTGNYTVELGYISGSSFVAESTSSYASSADCILYYGSVNGTYKVIRVTGTDITKVQTNCSGVVEVNGFKGFAYTQGIIDIRGKLPSCTSLYFATTYNLVNVDIPDINFVSGGLTSAFSNCHSLKSINTSGWNTSNITSLTNTFNGCYSLEYIDVGDWNTGNVTSLSCTFQYCTSLVYIDVSNWNTSKVTNLGSTFYYCGALLYVDVSNWNTDNVTNMSSTFTNCRSLSHIDVSNWNTSKVTNMASMFSSCSALYFVCVDGWNTENVTSIASIFSGCSSLAYINVSNWNTGKMTSMNSAFNNCQSLISIGDVSRWNTANVTSMQAMFSSCSALLYVDVSNWNMSNVTTISSMFYACYGLTNIDVSRWDTGKVTTISQTFYNCYKLTHIDISKWNLSGCTTSSSTGSTFYNCYAIYNSITIPSTVTMIGTNFLGGTRSIYEYHFKSTTPPTLNSTSAFSNMTDFGGKKIYVPSASLSAYQTASNWSTYASYMVGE